MILALATRRPCRRLFDKLAHDYLPGNRHARRCEAGKIRRKIGGAPGNGLDKGFHMMINYITIWRAPKSGPAASATGGTNAGGSIHSQFAPPLSFSRLQCLPRVS